MKRRIFRNGLFLCALGVVLGFSGGDMRDLIHKKSLDLEKKAFSLAQSAFDHFKGWDAEFSDTEQAVLFRSEAFAASCSLFRRLAGEKTAYLMNGYVRTNLYNAFIYLAGALRELEKEMDRAGVRPYLLDECRRALEGMEYEFSRWPAADNLAYLNGRYVKGRDERVYLVERKGPGIYNRRAFKNLESLFRYNYDRDRGDDPWQYLVEVPPETLDKMEEGALLELDFEGRLVIEMSNRPNRPVYLISGGKKRGVTSPQVLQRLGGWDEVFEIPAAIIDAYPEGKPVF